MASESYTKAILNCRAGSRDIVVDGRTVCTPNGVKSHRVAGLKTISMLAAQESRAARRPREESMIEGNRIGKVKNALKLGPHRVSKGAREHKMTKGLRGRAVVT